MNAPHHADLRAAMEGLRVANVPATGMAVHLRQQRLSAISDYVRRSMSRRGINGDVDVMAGIDAVMAWLERDPAEIAALAEGRQERVAAVLADPDAVVMVLEALSRA